MSNWYSLLDRHLLYPLYYWKNKDRRLSRLTEIEKHQYWSLENIQSLQLSRLKQIIAHAYSTVPFYRESFDRMGVHPSDLQKLADLRQFPMLSKQDIQQQLDQLISHQFAKADLMADSSGGSTGVPTNYYKDIEHHRLRAADQIRHDRWTGWDIGEPYALIWGAQKDLASLASLKQKIVTRYIHRCHPLDAFDMTAEKMAKYAQYLEKLNPPMILGYANALYLFAEFLASEKPAHSIRPQGIVSSAEALSNEKRALIERVFQTKVLNRYGSREVGLIASECPKQEGLHINADNLLVEIINDAGKIASPGESGEIVVTDFWNKGMPFIRYRMGDRGYMKEIACSCGRGLPLLGAVEGRLSDFLIAKSGKKIHGEYFTHLFYHDENVLQFQLIQESLEDVHLKLVQKSENQQKILSYEQEIKQVLGEDIRVTTRLVDDIPPAPSGKFMFTISKVN